MTIGGGSFFDGDRQSIQSLFGGPSDRLFLQTGGNEEEVKVEYINEEFKTENV